MIDANVLPDVVISLENASKDKDILLRRFCRERGLSEPLMEEEDKKKGTEKVVWLVLCIEYYVRVYQRSQAVPKCIL